MKHYFKNTKLSGAVWWKFIARENIHAMFSVVLFSRFSVTSRWSSLAVGSPASQPVNQSSITASSKCQIPQLKDFPSFVPPKVKKKGKKKTTIKPANVRICLRIDVVSRKLKNRPKNRPKQLWTTLNSHKQQFRLGFRIAPTETEALFFLDFEATFRVGLKRNDEERPEQRSESPSSSILRLEWAA